MNWLAAITNFLLALNPVLQSLIIIVPAVGASVSAIALVRRRRGRAATSKLPKKQSKVPRQTSKHTSVSGSPVSPSRSRSVKAKTPENAAAQPPSQQQTQHIENNPTFSPTITIHPTVILPPYSSLSSDTITKSEGTPNQAATISADSTMPEPSLPPSPVASDFSESDAIIDSPSASAPPSPYIPPLITVIPPQYPSVDVTNLQGQDTGVNMSQPTHGLEEEVSPVIPTEPNTLLDRRAPTLANSAGGQRFAPPDSIEQLEAETLDSAEVSNLLPTFEIIVEDTIETKNASLPQPIARLPLFETARPSGKLTIPPHIREQRRNLRLAIRYASFIVQEAKTSINKYARQSETSYPFRDEIRMHKVLSEYLTSTLDVVSRFNRAMNKLDIVWEQGDPRRQLFPFPLAFMELMLKDMARSEVSELLKDLRNLLKGMVRTAQNLGYFLRLESYNDPKHPNRQRVWILTKARNPLLEATEIAEEDESDEESDDDDIA